MRASKKKPRFASKHDRKIAECIAAGLRNPLGPDDEAPADAVVWTMDLVLYLLDHFAEHGTFDFAATSKREITRSRREALIPPLYRMLRADGCNYEEAVEKLHEQFHCSESTIRKLIPPGYFKKGPPVLK